jgi:hypothetical protein
MTYEKKQTRSDRYRYLIVETYFSDEMLGKFANQDSLLSHLNPYQYDERLIDLKDQLHARVLEIIRTQCTTRQQQVFQLVFIDGYTQMETAKILNCNQSSITKSLNGNVDYQKNEKVYGGLFHKLQKLTTNDSACQSILKQIEDLREDIL